MIEAEMIELWRQHDKSFIHDVMDIDRGMVAAMLRAALSVRS